MTEIAVEATQAPAQLPNVRVAVLGAGKMGGILVQAFLKQNLFAPDQIHATVAHAEKALSRSAQWGVDVSTDNLAAAKEADLILLGVKPFQVPDLVAEIRPALTPKKTLVSFAASVKTRAIEDAAGIEIAVIRAMPNTPSALGAGAAGLCRGRFVKPEQMALAGILGFTLLGLGRRRRYFPSRWMSVLLLFAGLTAATCLTACAGGSASGGGGGGGMPVTQTVTVTGTSGATVASTSVVLTVT